MPSLPGERFEIAPAGGQYHGGKLRFSVRYVKDLGEWDAKALLLRRIISGRQIQRIEPNRSLQYHLSADLLELLHGLRVRIAEQFFHRRASGGKALPRRIPRKLFSSMPERKLTVFVSVSV